MTSDPMTMSDGLVPNLCTQQVSASENPQRPPVDAASRIITQHYPISEPAFVSLDKTTFHIHPRVYRGLLKDPENFARKSDLPKRSIKRHRGGAISLKLLTYGGVTMKIDPPASDGRSDITVTFNPGKILYGHNGRIITYDEFLDALSIYITHAKHLLEDPDDWIDLIPGLRTGGPGRWRLLELPSHCSDPDGSILSAQRHLRHPAIRTQARHWPTSIELGGERAKLQFSIYRKAVEMLAHNKKLPARLLSQYGDILRLEARLKDKKLVHYVGNDDTVEVIDGEKCLVRFFPDSIAQASRTVFSELENVWHSDDIAEVSEQLGPLGILIARVARDPRVTHSFPELLRHLAFYCRVGSKRDTIRTIRGAGAGEMSHRSTLSFESIFSDAAFNSQPSIAIPEIECKVSHPLEDIRRDPLLLAAYTPPGWLSPRTDAFPPYCR